MSNKGVIARIGGLVGEGLNIAETGYAKVLDIMSMGEVQERQAVAQIKTQQSQERAAAESVKTSMIVNAFLVLGLVAVTAFGLRKFIK